MADVLQITTLYVTAGGVATVPFQGGHVTCRVTLGHITAEDGLLSELKVGAEVLPWASEKAKMEAITIILARSNLDEATKDQLIRHLKRASYFEPGVE